MKSSSRLALAPPNTGAAEAYMALRTNIAFAGKGEAVRTILITGPTEGCGKSTVALNLAHFTAAGGKTVALIDGDLRKQAVTRHFKLGRYPGLSTLLVSPESSESRPLLETTTTGLWVLPSGPTPPSSADLLASGRMCNFVSALGDCYALTIIDSPPVLAVADASILATMVDGIIVVANLKGSRRRELRRTVEQLRKVQGKLLGVVVNRATGPSAYFQYASYGRSS